MALYLYHDNKRESSTRKEIEEWEIPRASKPMSIGGPSGGVNWKLISPSSSPLRTETTPEICFLEVVSISALKAFRVMVVDGRGSPSSVGEAWDESEMIQRRTSIEGAIGFVS